MNYSIFDDTMVDMNWMEIEKKGKEKVPVLFPLGVIEEHGPHLPLGTDIYWSYAICKKIKDVLKSKKTDSLIAPPYYWGINHCTGTFSGSFSVKPKTMIMILVDIFENLHQFGFNQVYCVNYHGDPLHVKSIIDSIKLAREKFNMNIRLLIEPYDLSSYGLSGKEEYILLDDAEYSPDLFVEDDESQRNLLDIHAGALETAVMRCFFPDSVCKDIVQELKSNSLTMSELSTWLAGGKDVRNVVPLGYAGNPAGYKKKISVVESIFDILVDYCADKIIENNIAR